MTKININLQEGLIEVEGEEAFVQGIYNDFKEKLLIAPIAASKTLAGAEEIEKAQRSVNRTTKPGAGCGARIMDLDGGNFFSKPRSAKEISDKLTENATPYPAKHVAAALIGLTKRGRLRRMQQGGVWVYMFV